MTASSRRVSPCGNGRGVRVVQNALSVRTFSVSFRYLLSFCISILFPLYITMKKSFQHVIVHVCIFQDHENIGYHTGSLGTRCMLKSVRGVKLGSERAGHLAAAGRPQHPRRQRRRMALHPGQQRSVARRLRSTVTWSWTPAGDVSLSGRLCGVVCRRELLTQRRTSEAEASRRRAHQLMSLTSAAHPEAQPSRQLQAGKHQHGG